MSGEAAAGSARVGARNPSGQDYRAGSRRFIEEAFNRGNLDVADELIAPHAINHDPALPRDVRHLRGPELFKRVVSMYRDAFPDLHFAIEDAIAEDDRVAVRWHAQGTHRGELNGLAATGALCSVTGITINRWDDGKLVESWNEWDDLGLARQVGAAPPENSVAERVGKAMQRLMARRLGRRSSRRSS
jgi:steroid delta-isomerase-like uncharacterized protein